MLGLTERSEEPRALEQLAVEVHRRLESRRVVRPLPQARVRRQVEAAPLRQLLQLVLVHRGRPPHGPPALLRVPAAVAGDGNHERSTARRTGRGEETEVVWPQRGREV